MLLPQRQIRVNTFFKLTKSILNTVSKSILDWTHTLLIFAVKGPPSLTLVPSLDPSKTPAVKFQGLIPPQKIFQYIVLNAFQFLRFFFLCMYYKREARSRKKGIINGHIQQGKAY